MKEKQIKDLTHLRDVLSQHQGILKILCDRETNALYKKALADVLEAINRSK